MALEHHDLIHEFPHLKAQIHQLKVNDRHFRKLFDEYHQLTREVENMESETVPVTTATEEACKVRRLRLKDELHTLLQAAATAS